MIDWTNTLARIQGNFLDKDGNICVIQEGNLAIKDPVLRLGVLYEGDRYNTPMRLTVQQIHDLKLIKLLQYFVKYETLPMEDEYNAM